MGGFVTGMEQAARTASRRMREIESAFKKTLAVIGVGFGAGALKGAIEEALRYADNLDKVSERLGVNVEALQEYRFAAQQAGVGNEELDAGIQRLTVTLGKARLGSKEAIDTFRLLRLDPAQFQSTEQALDATLNALSRIGDEATRNALAVQLFGREAGPRLAAFAAQGAGEIDRLRRAARELGAVLDEETIKKAVGAQDQLEALAAVTKTQFTAALVDLAPVLIKTAELLTFAAKGVGLLDKAVQDYLARHGETNQVLERDEARRRAQAQPLLKSYADLTAAVQLLRNEETESARVRSEIMRTRMKELEADLKALGFKTSGAEISGPVAPTKPKKTTIASLPDLDAIRELDKAAEQARKNVEGILYDSSDAWDKYDRGVRQVNEALSLQAINAEEAAAALEMLEQERDDALEKSEPFTVFAEQAARNIQDLTAALLEGASSFKDFGASIVDTLKKIAAQFAAQQLLKAIFGNFTTASGGTGGFASFADFVVGGQKRAGGGSVAGGVPYLVGEQGPELFTPNVPGNIIPNGTALSGGGGVQVNVINQAPGAEATTERSKGSDGRDIINVVVREVARDIERGGQVFGAIQRVTGVRRLGRSG